ncbi:DJ-1/PfpI family protein [Streptomyces xiamenensis]
MAHARKALRDFGPLLKLDEVSATDYDAVVLPGGHGPVVDLFQDAYLGRLLVEADRAGKIIGAVCHGPAALLSAVEERGGAGGSSPAGGWPRSPTRRSACSAPPTTLRGCWRADCARWAPGMSTVPPTRRSPSRTPTFFTGQNPASSAPMADAINTAPAAG